MREDASPLCPRVRIALIHRSLGPLAKQAGTDETRPFLTAVHVRVADDRVTAEATDGGALLRVEGKTTDEQRNAADYPVVQGLPAATDGPATFDVMIPAEAWSDAFAAARKGHRPSMPILENVALAVTQDEAGAHAVLASTDLSRASVAPVRLVEGQYPRTDPIVAQKTAPKYSIFVDAEKLAGLLQTMSRIARPNGRDPVAMVRIDFYGPSDPVHVHGRAENTGYTLQGLIAPMRPHNGAEDTYARPWQREKKAEEKVADPAAEGA